jgi:aryl-alcohol dehydrogenase (NADP+)
MSYGSPNWRSWVLDEEHSRPFIQRALELGFNFFDTADVYSLGESERVVGAALRDFARRDQVVIATKVRFPTGDKPNDQGLSRKHIFASIDASLKRLQTDYVDLYQIHRFDYDTPIEETIEALHDVVKAGKARYIGASSMYAWQFMKMLGVARARGLTEFVAMQPQYNLIYREEEREMLPLCLAEGIGVIPWSPLARGFLAGGRPAPGQGDTERARTDELSNRMYYRQPDFEIVDAVSEIAKAHAVPNMQVALAWVLHHPAVTSPIIGATKPHHLDDAIAALKVSLSADELDRLRKLYKPKPVIDHS